MFDPDYFKALVREIHEAREQEIGCEECFEQVDLFVSMELSGIDAAHALPMVRDHLLVCGECRAEFEALLSALQAAREA